MVVCFKITKLLLSLCQLGLDRAGMPLRVLQFGLGLLMLVPRVGQRGFSGSQGRASLMQFADGLWNRQASKTALAANTAHKQASKQCCDCCEGGLLPYRGRSAADDAPRSHPRLQLRGLSSVSRTATGLAGGQRPADSNTVGQTKAESPLPMSCLPRLPSSRLLRALPVCPSVECCAVPAPPAL